jgi:hypothetical protein
MDFLIPFDLLQKSIYVGIKMLLYNIHGSVGAVAE